jgi:hypothetical protein
MRSVNTDGSDYLEIIARPIPIYEQRFLPVARAVSLKEGRNAFLARSPDRQNQNARCYASFLSRKRGHQMTRLFGVVCAMALVCALSGPIRAADPQQDAVAIVDKAIKAIGGEDKLSKAKAVSWKAKGTFTFMGNDSPVTTQTVVQNLDHFRQEFEGEFNGNKVKAVTVLNGDKGSRSFADNHQDLDKDALVNEKRMLYLTVIPITIFPLKDKAFKTEAIEETKVADKPAAGIKVTAPDGKDFKLYFDKESGLPVRLVAKVIGFMGEEYTQETTFSDYKEMEGIKKATKVQTKRDGEKFIDMEVTEFKVLDKDVDPKTFTEP